MIREPDVIDALAQALGRSRSVLGKAPPDKQVAAAAALAAITDLAEELAVHSDAPEHFLSKCADTALVAMSDDFVPSQVLSHFFFSAVHSLSFFLGRRITVAI